jgi:hypothetical protein
MGSLEQELGLPHVYYLAPTRLHIVANIFHGAIAPPLHGKLMFPLGLWRYPEASELGKSIENDG